MAEKDVKDILVSKESMLALRSAIMNSLADKKIRIAQDEAYLSEGNFKSFCKIFRKSLFARGAGYVLLASIAGIVALLWNSDLALRSTLIFFIGLAVGSIMVMGIVAVVSAAEATSRMAAARSRVRDYSLENGAMHGYLKIINGALGIDGVSSDEELTALIRNKMAF